MTQDSIDAAGFREACRHAGRLAEALGLGDYGHSIGEIVDTAIDRLAARADATQQADEDDATWALRTPSVWESPDARSVPTLLAAIGQVLAAPAREADPQPVLPGHFIELDADDTPTLWAGDRTDPYPRAVLTARQVDADVWAVLVAACEGGSDA